MNVEVLRNLGKEEIPKLSKNLDRKGINFLVKTLDEKDDKIRYSALLLLQSNSRETSFVYEHWDEFDGKLKSSNSYQRSIGAMLISENLKWDKDGRFAKTISDYLSCCSDEKFITSRQSIQGIENIVKATDRYDDQIVQTLSNLQLSRYKENQQKLIRKDISNVLKIIDKKKKAK